MKKVGIMGGTFNPIHNAHLALAQEAFDKYGLDQILFMPTKHPPHKDNREIISDEHRMNMVQYAIESNTNFVLSDLEIHREGITYTAETLKVLHELNRQSEYYFIVGGDSLMSISQWKEPKTIFSLSTIIAAGRMNYSSDEIEKKCEELRKEYHATILLLQLPVLEISSKSIRERLLNHESIRYYVPEKVYAYIKQHNLYI